jgi:hypothetical protein
MYGDRLRTVFEVAACFVMRPAAMLLGLTSLLMLPNADAGTMVHLFHYHKTGHDLILSVAGSLVRRQMVSPTAALVVAMQVPVSMREAGTLASRNAS